MSFQLFRHKNLVRNQIRRLTLLFLFRAEIYPLISDHAASHRVSAHIYQTHRQISLLALQLVQRQHHLKPEDSRLRTSLIVYLCQVRRALVSGHDERCVPDVRRRLHLPRHTNDSEFLPACAVLNQKYRHAYCPLVWRYGRLGPYRDDPEPAA